LGLGLVIHTLRSLYGEAGASRAPDEQWIGDAAKGNWLIFTKDDITKVPIQLEAMSAAASRVFYLPKAGLPGDIQVEHFTVNIHRILQRSHKPGPYLVSLHLNKPYLRWHWRPTSTT
jgi:hypothetical protein